MLSISATTGHITKFNAGTGEFIEHWKDVNLKSVASGSSCLYDEEALLVASQGTVRKYDSETGEFLETLMSKDGMDAQTMLSTICDVVCTRRYPGRPGA